MLRGGEGGGQGAHQVQHHAAGGDGGGKGFLYAFEAKDMAKNTMIILFLFPTNLQNIESSIEDQIQQLERLQREISESGGDESTISPLQVHLKALDPPFCCGLTKKK